MKNFNCHSYTIFNYRNFATHSRLWILFQIRLVRKRFSHCLWFSYQNVTKIWFIFESQLLQMKMPLLKCISVPSSQNLFKIATKTQFANTKFELTILHIPRSFPFIFEKILSNSRKLYMVFAVVELLLLFYETTNFKIRFPAKNRWCECEINSKMWWFQWQLWIFDYFELRDTPWHADTLGHFHFHFDRCTVYKWIISVRIFIIVLFKYRAIELRYFSHTLKQHTAH